MTKRPLSMVPGLLILVSLEQFAEEMKNGDKIEE